MRNDHSQLAVHPVRDLVRFLLQHYVIPTTLPQCSIPRASRSELSSKSVRFKSHAFRSRHIPICNQSISPVALLTSHHYLLRSSFPTKKNARDNMAYLNPMVEVPPLVDQPLDQRPQCRTVWNIIRSCVVQSPSFRAPGPRCHSTFTLARRVFFTCMHNRMDSGSQGASYSLKVIKHTRHRFQTNSTITCTTLTSPSEKFHPKPKQRASKGPCACSNGLVCDAMRGARRRPSASHGTRAGHAQFRDLWAMVGQTA
jgi:hypothetical protein